MVFESADGSTLALKSSHTPLDHLKGVSTSQNLKDLAASLQTIPDAAWVWLDIFIGAKFVMGHAPNRPDSWVASQLYVQLLSPLMPWFK